MRSQILVWLVGGMLTVLICGEAFAGVAHLIMLNGVDADTYKLTADPTDTEEILFEVIVDSSVADDVVAFEWQLELGSAGLDFDVVSSESASNNLVTDAGHTPRYLFYLNSFGFDAVESTKGIRGSDVTGDGTEYDPTGTSLGIVVVTVTDESAAIGWHSIQDPPTGFFLLSDYATTETLTVSQLDFEVTPEPATIALLVIGGLAVLRRRRAARTAR